MVRHERRLWENLSQLQNLIKRDPASYHEEFLQQYQHFQRTFEVLQLTPEQLNKTLDDQVLFLAQISQCYAEEMKAFPQQLTDLLEKHGTLLTSATRIAICRALILLRKKELLSPTDLLELFFKLLRYQDKNLRTFLEANIIADIKSINSKHTNVKLISTLRNFMYTMMHDSNSKVAKMTVDIIIGLYKKKIWNDSKTVNVLASGCFSKFSPVMVATIKFFLEKETQDEDSDNSDGEVDPKETILANKVNKKTRKREKQLKKVKKVAAAKAIKKRTAAQSVNTLALYYIHDPQSMAEKLFAQLDNTTRKFEVKMLILDFISKLIGVHQLFLFNYYAYIQRLFQPHQREVTRILQFAAQASHELLPPDVLEPLLKTLANNFITERNSSDVMAIGLNAVREICARCPLAINEDLVQDLTMYKSYKDRSVMMAARSIIHLFRETRPELLFKKDRGRPVEASDEHKSLSYGEVHVRDYIPGAEVLLQSKKVEIESSDGESENESADSEESLSDEEEEDSINEKVEKVKEAIGDQLNKSDVLANASDVELSRSVTMGYILGDEDFERIDKANAKKRTQPKKSAKRKIEENVTDPGDFVNLGDIENIYKKRKTDKKSRLETIKAGQMDREKFGYKDGRLNIHCSKTNREKEKTKNYQMVRRKLQKKSKASFKDKQIALRNHLTKMRKRY